MRFADALPDLGRNPGMAFMLGCRPLVHLGRTLGSLRSAKRSLRSSTPGGIHASKRPIVRHGLRLDAWRFHPAACPRTAP